MNVGTLTGGIELQNDLTSGLEGAADAVESFADAWVEKFGIVGAVAAGAAIAITSVTAAVAALAVKGADVNDITSNFTHFSRSAEAADANLEALRAGVRGTVDDMVLMGNASRALSAGAQLNAEDFKTLGDAAFVLQNRGLGSTKEMLDLISTAMVTGRTRTLAMKMGVVDAADAQLDYANKLGITKAELTQTQRAEARRLAVMNLLRGAVADAGNQELDFAEKLEKVRASISNWVDEFASMVAKSPAVNAALDSIIEAMQGFGTGSEALKTALGWVDSFASAVQRYAPPIIKAFIEIKNWVGNIIGAVQAAWNSIPDWLKDVAKAAAVASFGLYGVSKGLQDIEAAATSAKHAGGGGVSSAGSDLLGNVAKMGTITSAMINIGKALGVSFSLASVSVAGLATSMGLLYPSATTGGAALVTTAGAATGVVAALAGVGVTLAIGWQAWKLYSENTDRAAAAMRQADIDGKNLATLNQVLGTSFTDINAASKEWIKRNQEAKPAVDEHADAIARAKAIQEAYARSVQSVVDSVVSAQRELNVQRDAYERLGDKVLWTVDAQKSFQSAMTGIIAQNRELTESEQKRYDTITKSQINELHYQETILKTKGITLEMIDVAKALGASNQQLATSWGVSEEALSKYNKELETSRNLSRRLEDAQNELHGESDANRKIRENDRAFDDEVSQLDRLSDRYGEHYDTLARIREADDEKARRSIGDNMAARQAAADAALQDYMTASQSAAYSRDDLEKLKERYWELRDAVRDGNKEVGEGAKNAADRAKAATVSWLTTAQNMMDEAAAKAKALSKAMESTLTYDLTTTSGIAKYRRLNPGGKTLPYSDEAIIDFAKSGGTLEELFETGLDKSQIKNPTGYVTAPKVRNVPMTVVNEEGETEVIGDGGTSGNYGRGMNRTGINSGPRINMTFNVNGTAEESARKIGDILIKRVRSNRLLPNAG